jgi:hypothetical protein
MGHWPLKALDHQAPERALPGQPGPVIRERQIAGSGLM